MYARLLPLLLLIAPLAAPATESEVRQCSWEGDLYRLDLTIGAGNDPAAVVGKLSQLLATAQACTNPDCLPEAAQRPRLISGVVEQQLYWDAEVEGARYYGDLLVGRQPAELVVEGMTGGATLAIGAAGAEVEQITLEHFAGCSDPAQLAADPKAGAQM